MHFRSAAVPRGKLVPSPEGARNYLVSVSYLFSFFPSVLLFSFLIPIELNPLRVLVERKKDLRYSRSASIREKGVARSSRLDREQTRNLHFQGHLSYFSIVHNLSYSM